MKKYTTMLLTILLAICSITLAQDASHDYQKNTKLYSWINNLRVRSEPNLKSKTVALLKEGESVTYLGQKAGEEKSITLRGVYFRTNFLYVKMSKSGKKGWVYAGALQKDRVMLVSNKKALKRKFDVHLAKAKKMFHNFYSMQNDLKNLGYLNVDLKSDKKGQHVLYYKDNGLTEVGNRISLMYYTNGIVEESDDSAITYYLTKESINSLGSGVKYGMSQARVIKIIGRPSKRNDSVLFYNPEPVDSNDSMPGPVIFMFVNGKLTYICEEYYCGD